jgi:hypothetical protein
MAADHIELELIGNLQGVIQKPKQMLYIWRIIHGLSPARQGISAECISPLPQAFFAPCVGTLYGRLEWRMN